MSLNFYKISYSHTDDSGVFAHGDGFVLAESKTRVLDICLDRFPNLKEDHFVIFEVPLDLEFLKMNMTYY